MVNSTDPANTAINVPVGTDIEVTFSESMNATATQGAFSINPVVSGLFSWNTGNTSMTFDPTSALAPGTLYTANVSSEAISMAGIQMAADKVWSFTTANVISVTINDNGATGLSFGSPDPGTDKQREDALPSITITTGSENTADVAIYIKGSNFTDGVETINVDNAFYNDTDNSGTATPMSTTYSGTPWRTLGPDASLDIYHWLSIPAGTPPGDYTSTFTYKTEEV